jgi:hypothetical protein
MIKRDIEKLLEYIPTSEKIAVLESLCKKYRRLNSQRINAKQMGRRVDEERPDLQLLKNESNGTN